MKKALVSIAAGCALAAAAPFPAAHAASDAAAGAQASAAPASGMSHGEVRKVDASAGKLTIKHGPLENLGMDAMTMVFKVADPAMLSQVEAGDKIEFVAEDIGGALTVTRLRKQ